MQQTRSRRSLAPPHPTSVAVEHLAAMALRQFDHPTSPVRRPDVLDLPRPTPVRVHDLDRDRTTGSLHRPHVRNTDRLENPNSCTATTPKPLTRSHFTPRNARSGAIQVSARKPFCLRRSFRCPLEGRSACVPHKGGSPNSAQRVDKLLEKRISIHCRHGSPSFRCRSECPTGTGLRPVDGPGPSA